MSRAQPSGIAALLHDYRKYARGGLWLALALMLLGAIAEGFGLLMIVPLASIAVGQGSGATARLLPWLADFAPDRRFAVALGLFFAAMMLRTLLLYARDVRTAALLAGYEASLKYRCAATLAGRGWRFAGRIGQAGLQSLLLTDVPRAGLAVSGIQQIAIAGAMLMVQLALTALLSAQLTAVAVLFLAAGALLAHRSVRRSASSGMAIVQTLEDSADSSFRLHAGLKAALAQGTVAPFLHEYEVSLGVAKGQAVRFTRDLSSSRQLGALGAALAAVLLLYVGVRILAVPFPALIASLVLFARMSAPAQHLQQALQQVAAYAPAFTAIERRLGPPNDRPPAAIAAAPLDWKNLQFDAVAYEHQPGLGLRVASLDLRRGEWVGVSGPSGAGKTTLLDLAAGLLPPQQGSIGVDGQPLTGETLQRWHRGIAYAGQDGAVFDDSVRGNLLCEGAAADEALLWQALEQVGLAARVRAFAAGLDESVGDRGSQLSGGERQRLVIARALLRRPSVLILDEATAALDPQAEAELLQRLKALQPRPAALIVAHRESTLASCERRVTIQHGQVRGSDEPQGKTR